MGAAGGGGRESPNIPVTPPRIKFVPDYPPRKGKLFEIPQPTQNKCFGVNSGGGGIYSRGGSVRPHMFGYIWLGSHWYKSRPALKAENGSCN